MSDYTFLSKFLHLLALNWKPILEASHDFEKLMNQPGKNAGTIDRHVFVTGLARSGSSVLMRSIFMSDQFGSLTYRDMPFILSPNLGMKLSKFGRLEASAVERAHLDGVLVDYDTPEALEEVFWRVYTGQRYIHTNKLVPYELSVDELEMFSDYIRLILKKYNKGRYLSKNNNGLLRLKSISGYFPNSITLVPFREPLHQANSLLRQHNTFQLKQKDDAFVSKYMNWTVHHDFGSDHRPMRFSLDREPTSKNDLDFWLFHWIETYEAVLNLVQGNERSILPVCYEKLCLKDGKQWKKVQDVLGIVSGNLFELKSFGSSMPYSKKYLDKANEIYSELVRKSIEY